MYRILPFLLSLALFALPSHAEDITAPEHAPQSAEIPLDRPKMEPAEVIDWVAKAVPEALTFSWIDHQRALQEASKNFTKGGWESFTDALQKSHILDGVRELRQTVTAKTRSPPVIVQSGVLNRKYRWIMQVPLSVEYTSGKESRMDYPDSKVVVERTAEGLKITQYMPHVPVQGPPAPMVTVVTSDETNPPDCKAQAAASFAQDMPLDQPNMKRPEVFAWLEAAIYCAIDFNPENAETALQAPSADFTQDGWKSFTSWVQETRLLEGVREKREIVKVYGKFFPRQSANEFESWGGNGLLRNEVVNGSYIWALQMPIVISKQNGAKRGMDIFDTLIVIRRVPANENPSGIAIDEWRKVEMPKPAPLREAETARQDSETEDLLQWAMNIAVDGLEIGVIDSREEVQKFSRNFTKEGWADFTAWLGGRERHEGAPPRIGPAHAQIQKEETGEEGHRWHISMEIPVYKKDNPTQHERLHLAIVVMRPATRSGEIVVEKWNHLPDFFSAIIGQPYAIQDNCKTATSQLDPSLWKDAPLDQPNMEDAQLLAWARSAVCKLFTLDYENHETQLKDAAGFFTPEGYGTFRGVLEKSRLLQDMIQQQHVMTANLLRHEQIVQKGVDDGRYQWVVEIPVHLTIRAGDQGVNARTRVKLIVVRVPVTENPAGIAISSFAAN